MIMQLPTRPENRVTIFPVELDADGSILDPNYFEDGTYLVKNTQTVVAINTVLDHTNDPVTRVRDKQELLVLCKYHYDYWQNYFPTKNVYLEIDHWTEAKSSLTAITIRNQSGLYNDWKYVPYGTAVMEGHLNSYCYETAVTGEEWTKPVYFGPTSKFFEVKEVIDDGTGKSKVFCIIHRAYWESADVYFEGVKAGTLGTNIHH
jgi:hypothetical protein